MPSSKNYIRDYRQEKKTARRRGEHIDNKYRKRARRKFIRLNGESAAAGKDIDHKNRNPKSNGKSNLRAQKPSTNRSYSRKKNSKKYGNGKRK